MTTEVGRQPWLVYGLLRRDEGASPLVHSGNVSFTLLGFLGLYCLLRLVFLFLMGQAIREGPVPLILKRGRLAVDGKDGHGY